MPEGLTSAAGNHRIHPALGMNLFEPFAWKTLTLPTRIIFAPINTGFARNGLPRDRLLRFYRLRSGNSIGLSIVGNVAVHPTAVSNDSNCVLFEDAQVARYAGLSQVIRENGTIPGIQLAHVTPGLSPRRRWRNADPLQETRRLRDIIGSMPSEVLREHLDKFLISAALACRSGFEVIQIHAAHGYLLSLLLRSDTNPRSDDFSTCGTWLTEFIEQLRRATQNRWLSFRLSISSSWETFSNQAIATAETAQRLTSLGVDLVDLSAGLYTIDRTLIYPGTEHTSPPYLPTATTLALSLGSPVSFAGRAQDIEAYAAQLPDNVLVALGRPLIADPCIAQKIRDNRVETITHCASKGHCHYFSRGKMSLECGVNPDI